MNLIHILEAAIRGENPNTELLEQQQQAFVSISARFLRTVHSLHGEHTADAVRDAIVGILGPEWSNNITMGKLTGTLLHSDHYLITGHTGSDIIGGIRAIRHISGWGLADCRGAVMDLRQHSKIFKIAVRSDDDSFDASTAGSQLREAGFSFIEC